MGPDVPLLNDYKQEFFWKRFPQTVLGGPRLKLGYCAPPYVYIHQVALFLMPWLLGGVGTLLFQLRVIDDSSAGILSGALMLAFGAALQTLSQWVARRTGTVQRLAVGHNVMADEEEVEFTQCAGPDTVRFVVPGKRFMANVVLHTVLAGAMCGFGTWYLLPDRLSNIFGSVGAVVPVFALSWVTLCIGEYSLIVNTAAETATFQPQDTYEITALTRPLYIFGIIAVDLALRCVGGGVAELQVASQVMHVLFLVLPLLWALGMLPPLDALVLWIMEQSLIHTLGGSAMATNRRLVLMFLSSLCISISTFFLPSSLGVVLFSVATGFILSQDLTQIGLLLRCRTPDTQPHTGTHTRSLGLGWWSLPLSALVLTAALTEAALLRSLCPLGGWNVTEGGIQASGGAVPEPQSLIGWILITLCVITRVLRQIQGACVLGGLVLNPLYPKRLSSVQAFTSSSKGLWVAALVRRVLINLVCPLAMVGFLATDASLYELHSVASAVGFTRAFRAVWQNSEEALLQMVVVVMVRLADGGQVVYRWHDLGTGVQLIVVSLVSDRLSQFLLKLKFALTVLITSWTEAKQRRQSAGALLALDVALCPLLVAVVMLSALLSAPLLPLFTLPVFLVGFPRPLRSWPGTPGTACPCPDSIYYQQLSTRLASALTHAFSNGALGAYSPGSHFLGRFQDRVVWISVLEKGYGYCTVNIKGLELQETSCHTVEARRVDEVFEAAFDRLERPARFLHFLNPHWGNALTPCALLPVTVYSDARNVLTGIIDSPDCLRQLHSDFLKTLLWILLHHSTQNRTHRVKSHSLRSSQHAVQPEPTSHDAKLGVVSQNHFDCSSSPQLRGRSSLSSLSDWSDEDDLFGPVPVRKPVRRMMMRAEEEHTSLPGSVEIHSLYENLALASLPTLRPLGLGVSLEKDDVLPISSAPSAILDHANPPNFSSQHSETLSLPTSWFSAPFTTAKLRTLRPSFPEEWFRFCLAQLVMEGLCEDEDEQSVCRGLQEDRALMETYSQVALSCALALGMDLSVPSASFVFRVYCGDAAWHEGLDWLRENTELHQLTLRAFRYSVKLLIDQASLGPVESEEEFYSTLHHYEQHWFIGMATERGWHDGVLQEKPFLFSLGHDITMGSYTGRVLSLQECVFQLGALCEECVRGQWANLSWELLYATNDDEERYSIQAHTLLLRNLTVQAAEPPLGYPIYSCSPTHLTCF